MKLRGILPKWLSEVSTDTYSYGCVMLFFDFPELGKIHSLIDPADVYEEEEDKTFGLEDEPHTTLLYGLHEEVDVTEIEAIISGFTFTPYLIHNPSLFQNDKYDVLKFMVEGDNLHTANRQFRCLPHTTSFPKYNPHLTVAYLKAGRGMEYVNVLNERGLNNFCQIPISVVYSQPDGTKTHIPINVEKNAKGKYKRS